MSRHNRQRNRRWRNTQAKANHQAVEYGLRVWENHGKLSTAIQPLERLMVVAALRAQYESLRRSGGAGPLYESLAASWGLPRKVAKGRLLALLYREIWVLTYRNTLIPRGYSYHAMSNNHKAGNWVRLEFPEL